MKLGIFSLWTDTRKHEVVYGDWDALEGGLADSGGGLDGSALAAAALEGVSSRKNLKPVLELTPTPLAPLVVETVVVEGAVVESAPKSSRRIPSGKAAPKVTEARVRRTVPPNKSSSKSLVEEPVVVTRPARATLPPVVADAPKSSKRSRRPAPKSRRRGASAEALG